MFAVSARHLCNQTPHHFAASPLAAQAFHIQPVSLATRIVGRLNQFCQKWLKA